MTQHWENVWAFQTQNFRVNFDVTDDQDLDLSWDETGETLEGLRSGKYVAFLARVVVWYGGEIVGGDYLGGCVYESAREFIDHRGRNAKGYGSYFSDMVRGAIKEARKNLTSPRPYIRAAA